jgi:hypothetical protein
VKLKARYELGALIGEGGFGRTYEARDHELGRVVVVKELTLKGLPDWKPVEHFEREAKVLASLDHPGVPGFVEAFTLDDGEGGDLRYFIVSEKIDGETLQARIDAGHRWSAEGALRLTRDLLGALDYLHSIVPPVIHRDIKPANIVLTRDERPVLVDFGAVRDLGVSDKTTATVLGTPGYMAPEQALGRSDARSDLYGLGATLAHVFTHRHPQELLDESMRLDPRALRALPSSVRDILSRLTEPDPAARPANAADVLSPPPASQLPTEAVKALVPTKTQVEHLPAPLGGRHLPPRVLGDAALATMRPENMKKTVLPPLAIMFIAAFSVGLAPGVIGPALPFVILACLGAIFGSRFVAAKRGQKAARHGIESTGFITAANAGNQGTFLEFTYEVEGRSYQGHAYSRDALALAKLEKGSPIHVYYDPADPTRYFGTLSEFEES